MTRVRFVWLLVSMVLMAGNAAASELRLAVTTSFNNSGLSEVLLPQAEKDTGIVVRLLVVGTGQALKLAEAGDVDAVLVHSKAAEQAFVNAGFATYRREIMYNDFVLIGPGKDPAGIAASRSVLEALDLIATARVPFISRGDDSGTHRKELALWKAAGHDPASLDTAWYLETGSGMGAALNTASGLDAYILADRASWLKFGNKGALALLYSGDKRLFNQYAFLPVNPERHPHVRHDLAVQFEAWLVSPKVQSMIGAYRIDGEGLFVPNAEPDNPTRK
ncbi:MAG: substrate-binding domain-containing protein [Pseudomonadota bacterium]